MDSSWGIGDDSLINSFREMGEICKNSFSGMGNNSLINSSRKLLKYVKRVGPCEKFDHFFYFFKKFFVYLLKEVDFFS